MNFFFFFSVLIYLFFFFLWLSFSYLKPFFPPFYQHLEFSPFSVPPHVTFCFFLFFFPLCVGYHWFLLRPSVLVSVSSESFRLFPPPPRILNRKGNGSSILPSFNPLFFSPFPLVVMMEDSGAEFFFFSLSPPPARMSFMF